MANLPPPGWYRDPANPATFRWWDGIRWAAPQPNSSGRPAWPWSTGISQRTYLTIWIGAVALLEALGVFLARVAIGFDWLTSLAVATVPGPVVLIGLGAVGWSLRPQKAENST